MNPTDAPNSPIGALLTALRDEGTTLLRQEVALAKAELSEKASEIGRSTANIAVGGAVAYAGALVLLIGIGALAGRGLARLGLSTDVAQWLGFVVVGAIVALVGWSMLNKAKRALRAQNLVPRETMASLQDNQRWARRKIHHAHEPAT
jgi:hypothetical protein